MSTVSMKYSHKSPLFISKSNVCSLGRVKSSVKVKVFRPSKLSLGTTGFPVKSIARLLEKLMKEVLALTRRSSIFLISFKSSLVMSMTMLRPSLLAVLPPVSW